MDRPRQWRRRLRHPESDTNLSPERRAYAERNLDRRGAGAAGRRRALFPAANPSRRRASMRSSKPKAFISRTLPAAATWISTATMCITSAMAIRGSSAPSPSRWMRCLSRRAATPPNPRSRWRIKLSSIAPVKLTARCCSRPAAPMRSKSRSRSRVSPPAATRPCRSGMRFMARASARPPLAARLCSAPVRIGPLMPGAEHVAPFSSYRCPYGTSSAEESPAKPARA